MSEPTKVSPADLVKQATGKIRDVRDELNARQVKLRTNKRFKLIVVAVTFFAALADFMGTVIVMPLLPSLCVYATGGPFADEAILANYLANFTCTSSDATLCADEKTAAIEAVKESPELKAIISPHAFKDLGMGMSTAVELPMAIGQFFSAAGSFVAGNLVDRIGAKKPMIVCLVAGIGGYVLIYAAGIWLKSYWLFAIGLWVNSLFGVVTDIAQTYMGILFQDSPADRDLYVGLISAVAILGGTIGAFVVMPFATGNGANVFLSIFLAIGITVLAIVLVIFVIVEPPKQESTAKEAPKPKTAKFAKILLYATCVGSAFDSGGDVGTQMVRSSLLMNIYPEWGTAQNQNILLLVLIGVAALAFVFLALFQKWFSLATICAMGAFASMAVQIVLGVASYGSGAYIAIWLCGQCFGFLSTFGSGLMVAAVAPPETLGAWNGLNAGATNAAVGVSQLVFARVYDGFNNGTVEGTRGQNMLICTAAVSFLSLLVYGSLIFIWPKPKSDQQKKRDEAYYKDLDSFVNLSEKEWTELPLEVTETVNEKLTEAGKPRRVVGWGDYTENRELLLTMDARAVEDFTWISKTLREVLSSRAMMTELQKAEGEDKMDKAARDKAKAEMGAWIADYFDDAGYKDWDHMTILFKSMLMDAFPPIDPLDDVKPDYAKMPIDQYEECMLKFLEVMDGHLATAKKRRGGVLSSKVVGSAMRRR